MGLWDGIHDKEGLPPDVDRALTEAADRCRKMTPADIDLLRARIAEHLESPEFQAKIAPFRTPVTAASMLFMLD